MLKSLEWDKKEVEVVSPYASNLAALITAVERKKWTDRWSLAYALYDAFPLIGCESVIVVLVENLGVTMTQGQKLWQAAESKKALLAELNKLRLAA